MFLHTSAKKRDFGLKKSHSRLFRGAFASLGTLVIAFVFVPYIESLSNSYATKVGSLTHVNFNIAETSLTMTIDNDSTTTSAATSGPGQYVLLDSVVNVATNAPAGYELYLTGYDNNFTAEDDVSDENFDPTFADEVINHVTGYDYSNNGSNIPSTQTLATTRLINTADSTKYIAGIVASNPTVLSTASSNWGYALASTTSGVQISGFSSTYTDQNIASGKFLPVTNTSQKIVKTSHADTTGVDQTIYYGAYLDSNIAAGTYTNSVIYTAVVEDSASSGAGNLSISPVNGLKKSTLTIISDYDSADSAVTTSQIETYIFTGSTPTFSGSSTVPTNAVDTCTTASVDSTLNGNNKNLKYTCTLTADSGFAYDTEYGVVTIIDGDTSSANWAVGAWTYLTTERPTNPGTDIQDDITNHQPGVTYRTTTSDRTVTTSTLNTSTSPATVDFTFGPETAQGVSSSASTSLAAKAVENGSLAWLVVAAAASTTAMWVAVVALKDDDDEEE
ncbi:hypothetical protein IJG76_00400 [Candidatus Saccharibacteria bacterium]|nr:hypothetical protein [Candidatus Saccharibacteria bacterium]